MTCGDWSWAQIKKTGFTSRNWSDSSISLDERHADPLRVSFFFPTDLGRSKETLLAGYVFQRSKAKKWICFFVLLYHALFLCHSLLTGLDARGFLFGPIIAMNLDKAFIPVRKTGKLPGPTIKVSSTKEYERFVVLFHSVSMTPQTLEQKQNCWNFDFFFSLLSLQRQFWILVGTINTYSCNSGLMINYKTLLWNCFVQYLCKLFCLSECNLTEGISVTYLFLSFRMFLKCKQML